LKKNLIAKKLNQFRRLTKIHYINKFKKMGKLYLRKEDLFQQDLMEWL
jgi:hypothetical protein